MRAAWYEGFGPAREVLQLGDKPDPEPGPGEVQVRLRASGVNPSDVKTRAGGRGDLAFDHQIPHSDGAGEIDAVGAGVTGARVGERVWVYNAAFRRPGGTAAHYTVLPSEQAVALPGGAGFDVGACLGIPAQTAHRCVFADGPVHGQTVLVTGGAGAVGHYAVQLAKWGGARVLATVSSERKAEHARAAGADGTIDYTRADVAKAVLDATDGAGVDRIVEVEFGGNLATTQRILKTNGVIAAYGSMAEPEPTLPFYPLMFAGITLRMVLVYILPETARAAAIADLTEALQAGALQHPIAARYPLDRIADAHEAVEADDKLGQVIVEIE